MVASPAELTTSELELRARVREFLAETLPRGTFEPGLGMGAEVNPEFSAALAERGWIGMAVPARYGGHDATAVDRFVVVEELLRWGAPVGHHWVADRQIAQVLLRYGTEEQKQWLLPRICRGELCFCIGMSEPDAGSDLASVRTRGVRDTDGWRVSGVKVWTSNATRADFMIALCRTGDGERHAGLSRFLIDMRSPGVSVTPIPFLNGSTDHFAEVVLDGVLVPHDRVIGEIGQGWAQNADELAFERSGPDRWISTFLLVQEFLREYPDLAASTTGSRLIGELAAQYWVLRRLSLTVARAIDAGRTPAAEAALIKEMGTRFEQDVVRALRELLDRELVCGPDATPFQRLLRRAVLDAPSFTIRGGTTEVLRSVAAKGLA
ncbi:acyl-CoA dehydrogenase family protein [Mycobacterium conspicuum]|jgi:alkylation response protein AidB-like acyl-CoA dehydrogenase|uniref:Acyl-CoA dehydrogenase n=1 Tax=Mycobacterium conspicuum TaxID=44010 RepID=A0A1X1THH8_9MYCO|nr:acyl-CoA dehydrogenase family protein [Mycobacterium conspicuum]ORV43959.1 acyl-CoA dehydrogenase [Mycobacterium conspicuum]BBZ38103.1 acyl-CoA dehydrogenase [Mycobacterium conspicuum]